MAKITDWFKLSLKIDFFRLLTLKIVLVFLGLTVARIVGAEVDDTIYDSWTMVLMAMLPSSGVKESVEGYNRSRGELNRTREAGDGNETQNTKARPRL